MPTEDPSHVHVQGARTDDEDFLCQIAPRLPVGYAPWRDPSPMLATMERFLLEGLAVPPEKGAMVIAERSDGTRLGVATVAHHVNFTGEPQAYLGELAVIEEAEGQGVGRLLVEEAERWVRQNRSEAHSDRSDRSG